MSDTAQTDKYHLLIVDDDDFIRTTIGDYFEEEGYSVTLAEDGIEALQYLEKEEFDLVISDLMMPHLDGFGLMERSLLRSPETPIIILTGQGTLDNAIKAIQLGAYDFATKPIANFSLLRISVERGLEKRELLVSRRNYQQQIERQNKLLIKNLEVARKMQQNMISRDLLDLNLVSLAWRYIPSERVSGDFFGVFEIDKEHVAFYIADVSGHGVPAAMVTVFIKQTVYKLARERLADGSVRSRSPVEVLSQLNGEFLKEQFEFDGIELYVTLFYGLLDFNVMRLSCANAGHAPLPKVLRQGHGVEEFSLSGHAIGFFDDAQFDQTEISFSLTDRIFLCTDAVTEAKDGRKTMFGNNRLMEQLKLHHDSPSETILDNVVSELKFFTGNSVLEDDLCLLLISPDGSEPTL
ncbi:MAG: SpoIIE family protein phosphatase [Deltaproteobacteria bacterium]|nr:SpoIIE family protein phosphatase [Deltaproteobacteria bacterium]